MSESEVATIDILPAEKKFGWTPGREGGPREKDILADHGGVLVAHLWEDGPVGMGSVALEFVSRDAWDAALQLGINPVELKVLRTASRYDCPVNGYKHHCLVPTALHSADLPRAFEKFKRQHWYEHALDQEWARKFTFDLDVFSRALLGPGYVGWGSWRSGSSRAERCWLKLSNGDWLECRVLIWIGK